MLCMGRRLEKTILFVNHVFWAYLNHSLSDIYIGNILGYLLLYRTNCTPSRTKRYAQNKSDKIVFLAYLGYTLSEIYGKYPTYKWNKSHFKSNQKTHAK